MDQSSGSLRIETRGDVATLILCRPDRKNALDLQTWTALPDVLASLADTAAIKVVIMCGAGGDFSSGADISEFATVFATTEGTEEYFNAMNRAMSSLADFPKATIAQIEGVCIGGGLAIALACDLRMAARTARLAVTPAKIGLLYPLEDTRRLVQAVGASRASDLLFTGRTVDPDEALAIGLIDAVSEPQALRDAVRRKADDIAAVSQWTVERTKRMLRLIRAAGVDPRMGTWICEATRAPDFEEGVRAFHDRRAPVFLYRIHCDEGIVPPEAAGGPG